MTGIFMSTSSLNQQLLEYRLLLNPNRKSFVFQLDNTFAILAANGAQATETLLKSVEQRLADTDGSGNHSHQFTTASQTLTRDWK